MHGGYHEKIRKEKYLIVNTRDIGSNITLDKIFIYPLYCLGLFLNLVLDRTVSSTLRFESLDWKDCLGACSGLSPKFSDTELLRGYLTYLYDSHKSE